MSNPITKISSVLGSACDFIEQTLTIGTEGMETVSTVAHNEYKGILKTHLRRVQAETFLELKEVASLIDSDDEADFVKMCEDW